MTNTITTKTCATCGQQTKDSTEFYKDSSRADGLQWRCKQCTSERNQNPEIREHNRRRANSIRREQRDEALEELPDTPRLSSEEFEKLYQNRELETYIGVQANRYAKKRPDFQETLIQEAWDRISLAVDIHDIEELKKEAHRAIETVYRNEWKNGKVFTASGERVRTVRLEDNMEVPEPDIDIFDNINDGWPDEECDDCEEFLTFA